MVSGNFIPSLHMIDTLDLSFSNIQIPRRIYSDWENGGHTRKGSLLLEWSSFIYQLPNKASIEYKYIPYLPNFPNGLLKLSFSLPKVIYGNNFQMIDNIKDAIDSANLNLPSIPEIPVLDLWNSTISRLDACYNHQVGNLVPYYIDALQSLEYSHRQTGPYTTQGVQYQNKQVSTKFYNKEKECGDSTAYGILRQETSLRREKVKKLTGKKKPTLHDLSPDLLFQTLEDDLKELKLFSRSIGTADTTLSQLCESYGEFVGIFYYGLLYAGVDLTKDRLISATGSHPRSMDRRLKNIVDAGIPLTITKHIEQLPPLVIDWNCMDDK